MLKKTLLTAAAALAVTAGATAMHTPDASAGGFSITIGNGHYGGGYYGYYDDYCFWKKKKVKISYWNGWKWKYKWVWKRYQVCW